MDNSLAPLRKCVSCREDKSLLDFYIKVNKGKHTIGARCNFCEGIYRKARSLEPKDEVEGNKECSDCKLNKDVSEFAKNSSSKDGLMSSCKQCKKEVDFKDNLKRKYGLSLDQFNKMRLAQRDACIICLKIKPLVVDHCHKTGEVRGLLCQHCNSLIGFAYDTPEILERAASYVRR